MPELSFNQNLPPDLFDVIIVGTGVVGCAMARRFALQGARVIIIDKSVDILDGASKANSAILHTGFDAPPPGSQEHTCLTQGYQEYLQIRERLNLPLLQCAALVLAWNQDEADRLQIIQAAAMTNGVSDTRIINATQLQQQEPAIGQAAVAALEVPGESVIDPWSAPAAYLMQALDNGATLARHCELIDGQFDGTNWELQTSRGCIKGRHLINCAGLYGDRINHKLLGESDFQIRPRKGQFVVFDKSARDLIQSVLLPVPTEVTKGIVVCPTIFGNLLVGPTAEEQDDRESAEVDHDQLKALIERGQQILPALKNHSVTATYAGLRPASEFKDYQIKWTPDKNYCCVGAIRSTGLSAALGIASFVFSQYEQTATPSKALVSPIWPNPASIAETETRDWQCPGNNGIVCHCELVTRREIREVLEGPLPPASLAGLKRRTRVTMGRCQGFYCSAELSELTAGRFELPIDCPRR